MASLIAGIRAAVEPDDIELTNPGRKLWRTTKPKAIHVVSVFRNGKRRYYQVTDPLLFEIYRAAITHPSILAGFPKP